MKRVEFVPGVFQNRIIGTVEDEEEPMVTLVKAEVRRRGPFGKLVKYIFIAFNILMIVWLLGYWVQVGELISGYDSEAAKTGAAIGTTLGTGFIIFFWAAGDLILGLFVFLTRGKKLITEEIVQ